MQIPFEIGDIVAIKDSDKEMILDDIITKYSAKKKSMWITLILKDVKSNRIHEISYVEGKIRLLK